MSGVGKLLRKAVFAFLVFHPVVGFSAEQLPPEITSQGFDLNLVQQGVVGEFGRIRIRFEVPARIDSLQVRERSFEVDLARTPERQHLPLFGLANQVRQLTDVTLDFSSYINEKIREAGEYIFELQVTDRRGRSASASLKIVLIDTSAHVNGGALETGKFEFVRRGASPVTGAEEFGIGWITVESNQVVVSVSRSPGSSGKLFEVSAETYEMLSTKAELEFEIEQGQGLSAIHLPAAGNRSAGRVLGVLHDHLPGMLKITDSQTTLSEIGTTVTLKGEYKR